MQVDSYREQGGVNDSYVLIYECEVCKLQGYTASKNTKDISGAIVVKVLDKDIFSTEQIDIIITKLN